jgi:hypothetical protein
MVRMLLGLARDARQTMDRSDLIHYLYLVAICLAAWGGYVVGLSHA